MGSADQRGIENQGRNASLTRRRSPNSSSARDFCLWRPTQLKKDSALSTMTVSGLQSVRIRNSDLFRVACLSLELTNIRCKFGSDAFRCPGAEEIRHVRPPSRAWFFDHAAALGPAVFC